MHQRPLRPSAAYLAAATDLLVDDLREIGAAWQPGGRGAALADADGDLGLAAILTGLGSLSYGELAGERMKLGLLLHDPEEEHDCFSDNTHNSHYYNQVGMMAVWNGRYERIDGTAVEGPSVADVAAAKAPRPRPRSTPAWPRRWIGLKAIKAAADSGQDGLRPDAGGGQPRGNAMLQAAIDAPGGADPGDRAGGRGAGSRDPGRGLGQPRQPGARGSVARTVRPFTRRGLLGAVAGLGAAAAMPRPCRSSAVLCTTTLVAAERPTPVLGEERRPCRCGPTTRPGCRSSGSARATACAPLW